LHKFFEIGSTVSIMIKTRLILLSLSLALLCSGFSFVFAQEYEIGRSDFEKYRENKIAEITQKTGGYRLPSAPFALLHPSRTKYSALLIHGLNDSPYYLKDIAQILFDRGFNVITVLLPAHGLTLLEMKQVSYLDWIREVQLGLRLAAQVGENVTVGGFSAGGLLAISSALSFESVKGLFLFAPALKIKSVSGLGNRTAALTCISGINRITYDSEVGNSPVKYGTRAVNGACQVIQLVDHVYNLVGSDIYLNDADNVLVKIGARLNVPTFLTVTTSDLHLNSRSIVEFGRALRGNKSVLVYSPETLDIYPFLGLKVITGYDIEHAAVVLESNAYNRQFNPGFYHIRESMNEFLRLNFL